MSIEFVKCVSIVSSACQMCHVCVEGVQSV